ncbi:MAG: arsenite methyltransferase [Balneolales bacterium]
MSNSAELKDLVKQKYTEIAHQDKETNQSSCCGSGSCSTEVYNIMSDDYSTLKGYSTEADLGLGCGLPTEFAGIKPGDTVVDLGSGAGNDCFVARHETGDSGLVIGIDFSEAMIAKAHTNAEKLGYTNIEFHLGEIEEIPLPSSTADVVVSNCVLNLVPHKPNAFREINRILKPGKHFSISDIVLTGKLPEKLHHAASMYTGCISGAIRKEDYLGIIKDAGFKNIALQKEKDITIPDDILNDYLNSEEIKQYKEGESGITSITVYAEKS